MAEFEGFEIKADAADFTRYAMQPDDKARFVDPGSMLKKMVTMGGDPNDLPGLRLPFDGIGRMVRFPPGQVTLWGGYTHHGKTKFLKQVMLEAMSMGEAVCIASMEESPEETLYDMACCALQWSHPSEDALDIFCTWASKKLWLYNQQRMISPDRLIGVANYAAVELGCKHFVTDSLMRLEIPGDDYEKQRVFGNAIGQHARAHGYHHHVVAHVRKGEERKLPNQYDIKGTGDLVNQADRVILVWRNKIKPAERGEDDIKSDAVIIVDKQRGRPDWLGKIGLDYDRRTCQFIRVENGNRDPRHFFPLTKEAFYKSEKARVQEERERLKRDAVMDDLLDESHG